MRTIDQLKVETGMKETQVLLKKENQELEWITLACLCGMANDNNKRIVSHHSAVVGTYVTLEKR